MFRVVYTAIIFNYVWYNPARFVHQHTRGTILHKLWSNFFLFRYRGGHATVWNRRGSVRLQAKSAGMERGRDSTAIGRVRVGLAQILDFSSSSSWVVKKYSKLTIAVVLFSEWNSDGSARPFYAFAVRLQYNRVLVVRAIALNNTLHDQQGQWDSRLLKSEWNKFIRCCCLILLMVE